ncbi:alpha/beta fold hydrolase [Streptomyces sp. enrichment culture]|uniref:alpha/beta fold hydrolase n=1 Tax=Streptomyces sp. enrichment culture TaxID=1795815 RepID=UPI003F54D593
MPAPDGPGAEAVRRRTAGTGGPRLLLVHGLAANDSVWDRCVGLLPRAYEVWSARLPWSAEGVPDWGVDGDLVGPLAQVLAAVPGGPQIVVAHSMSADVLLDLVDRESRQGGDALARLGIRALVLVSPFYRRTVEEFDWETISHYLNDFHLIMEEGLRVHSGDRLPASLRAAMGERVRDRVGPYGWLRFFELYLRTPQLQTGRVTVPCLVLGGKNDFAAPPGESVTLAAALPDARALVLPGCGHFPMIEEAERFASETVAFVNSLGTGAPQREPVPDTALEHRR